MNKQDARFPNPYDYELSLKKTLSDLYPELGHIYSGKQVFDKELFSEYCGTCIKYSNLFEQIHSMGGVELQQDRIEKYRSLCELIAGLFGKLALGINTNDKTYFDKCYKHYMDLRKLLNYGVPKYV